MLVLMEAVMSAQKQGFQACTGKFPAHTLGFLRPIPLSVLGPAVSHKFSTGGISCVKPYCHQP